MKLGPPAKLVKKNKTASKKSDSNVMSKNCDVIAIFPICSQSGAIWNPDSESIVCKLIFSLAVIFYLTKIENRTKKSLTQLSY